MVSQFILASASPQRLKLLTQAGFVPDQIVAPEIDETPKKNELPIAYAKRIARAKAEAVAKKHPEAIILAADTVTTCGRRMLHKTEDEKTARKYLELLSGRRHRVYTSVAISHAGKIREALAMTQVRFRRLTNREIEDYLKSGEWRGKAGGCSIQGRAESWIPAINGSYSNVVGLPMAEVCSMLAQAGIHPDGA